MMIIRTVQMLICSQQFIIYFKLIHYEAILPMLPGTIPGSFMCSCPCPVLDF